MRDGDLWLDILVDIGGLEGMENIEGLADRSEIGEHLTELWFSCQLPLSSIQNIPQASIFDQRKEHIHRPPGSLSTPRLRSDGE